MSEACIFCKMASGEITPDIVWESEDILAFRDINPVAPSHILIIPRRHIATLNELRDADESIMGKMLLAAQEVAAQEGIADDGYRLVFNCNENGGQTVFHIHLHLLGGRNMQWPPG